VTVLARTVSMFQSAGFTWVDALDVLLVAFVFYELLQFLRGTHALQMALGAVILVGLYWTSEWLHLQALSWLLQNVLPYAAFGVIVIFQAEIRKVLAHIGKTPFLGTFGSRKTEEVADEVVLAATTLARRRPARSSCSSGRWGYAATSRPDRPRRDRHLRPARQHLQSEYAAARRRRRHSGEPHRGRRLFPAAHRQP